MSNPCLLSVCCLVLVALAGCGPAEEELAATVAARGELVLAGTLTAQPTATRYPTGTPYPTLAPLPTMTPLPTGTSYPTRPANPTATRYPTHTPLLTIPTATPRPISPPYVPPPTATRDARSMARTDLTSFRDAMGAFTGIMDQAGGYDTAQLDCAAVVAQHGVIVGWSVPDTSGMDPGIQNAYAQLQTGKDKFANQTRELIEICKLSLADGEKRSIREVVWNLARGTYNWIMEDLTPIIRSLGGF